MVFRQVTIHNSGGESSFDRWKSVALVRSRNFLFGFLSAANERLRERSARRFPRSSEPSDLELSSRPSTAGQSDRGEYDTNSEARSNRRREIFLR